MFQSLFNAIISMQTTFQKVLLLIFLLII